MVVASSKLEGLADALEMTDVIIETAKQLKASLNQAKKGNTPAALAAASATLGLSRTVVNFSRDAHILLNKSVPKWLPAPPGGSASGSSAASASASARASRPAFAVSPARAKKTAIGRVAAASAAAAMGEPAPLGSLASPIPHPSARPGYTLVVNEKTSGAGLRASAPSLFAADRERDAEDAPAQPLGSLSSPAPAASAAARDATEDDLTPRDSDSSPTPTAKTKSAPPSRARPSSAPAAKRRVSVSDAADDAAAAKPRKPRPASAKPATKAGADADTRAAPRAAPRVSRPSTPRGSNNHMRRTASRSYTTETLMVKRAGIGNPVCVVHRRLDDASPEKAAEEIIELLRAVQTKLGMGAPVASLVNAKDGSELSFAQYAEPAPTPRSSTPRVFPPGSVFVALTAGEMRARAAKLRASEPKVKEMSSEADADDHADGDADDDADERESDSPAPLPARRGLAIEVTREASDAGENATTVRVAVPSYVETIGETLIRVSEALRDDGVSGATCVSLHATGEDGDGDGDAETGVRTVAELVDGGRYRVRCADDLSVNDDDQSAAARKRRDEEASFEVDVAPREDPTGEGATIRLPGARALSRMSREDVCERVRVAVGLPTDADANAAMGLYRFDGSKIERPEEITPGMRLLYGEANAEEGLPEAVVATATEVFEASVSREAPQKSHAKSPTSTAAKSAAALLREEPTSTRKTRATTTTTTLPTRAPKAPSHLPPPNALPPTPPTPVSTSVIIKKNPSPTAAVRANPFAAAEASEGEKEDVAETSPGRVRARKTPTPNKAKSPAKIKGIMPGFQ